MRRDPTSPTAVAEPAVPARVQIDPFRCKKQGGWVQNKPSLVNLGPKNGGGGGVKNVPVSTYMKISSYLRASCRRRGISGSGSRDSASAGSCRWRSCGPRRRCRPSCSGRCAWRSPCRTRRWAGRSGSPTPGRGGQVFCQHLVVTQDFLLLKLPNVFFVKTFL